MKDSKQKGFANLKKEVVDNADEESRKHLDELLSASLAEAELESYEKGKQAKRKVKTLRELKKEEAIKRIEEEEREIIRESTSQVGNGKDRRINFDEYQPKFTGRAVFRIFLVVLVLSLIGAGFFIYSFVQGQQKYKIPSSITLNTTRNGTREYYHYTDEPIELMAWINEEYTGSNQKINITTSGNNEIIILPSEVQSGQIFSIDIVKISDSDYVKGGVVRIFVSDDATGLQKDWVDVIIDTPVTGMEFGLDNTVYASQQISAEVTQRTGSVNYAFTSNKDRLYKPVEYSLFVESETGGYHKDASNNFLLIEPGTEDDYTTKYSNDYEDTSKIATIDASGNLTGLGNGEVWVVALCSKYIDHIQSPDDIIFSAKKYIVDLVDITEIRIGNSFTSSNIYLDAELSYDLSDAIHQIISAESLVWFNAGNIQDFYKKFFTVEASLSSGVTIEMVGTLLKITASGLDENTTFNLIFKYKGESVTLKDAGGNNSVNVTFTVKY